MFQVASAQGIFEFTNIDTEQGISQVTIFDIEQDHDGFMWFATQDGLNRYDGYEFKVFRNIKNDPASLSDSFIYDLFVDSKNNLWVATRNGLNLYNREQQSFQRFMYDDNNPKSISGNNVKKIIEDEQGYLWVATTFSGLNKLNPDNYEFESIKNVAVSPNNQDSININDLILDTSNKLWVASGSDRLNPSRYPGKLELLDIETGKVEAINEADRFLRSNTAIPHGLSYTSLFIDNQMLWVGTDNGKLLKINLKSKEENKAFSMELIIDQNLDSITDIEKDAEGNVWVSTRLNGIYILDEKKQSKIQLHPDSKHSSNINDKDIVSIFRDRSNVIWVGTWTRGLKKLSPNSRRFEKYLQSNSFVNREGQPIRAISKDQFGKIWLAAWNSGLISLDLVSGKTEHHTLLPPSMSGSVREVFCDSNGDIWVGTANAGVFRIAEKTEEIVNYQFEINDPQTIASNTILNIFEDHLGIIWIATRGGGLNKFDREKQSFTRYLSDGQADSLSDNSVVVVFNEGNGLFWVGTENGGLNIFDSNTGKVVALYDYSKNPNHIGTVHINDIFKDRKGNVFLATDKGVSRVYLEDKDSFRQRLTFKLLGEETGRAIGPTGGIFDDSEGFLWASTITGIFRLSIDGATINYYGRQFGALEKGYYIHSKYRDADGAIYFGAVDGLTRFYPENVTLDPYKPEVSITRLMLFDREVTHHDIENKILSKAISQTQTITLNHLQNAFSLEFSALEYSSPIDNQFSYKLEGFNREWLFTGADNRRATYTNLDPGTYQFFVKASNSNGVWGDKITTLQITVLPAWWKSKLAYLIYFLLVVALIFYINRQVRLAETLDKEKTIAQLEKDYAVKSNELKSKFLANMSHEIRTPMNAIIGLSELALRVEMEPKLGDYLTKIRSSAKSLLRIIDDILDYSKIDADKLELEKRAFQLEDVVKEVINVVSPKASEKQLELIVSHLEDIDFKLIGDELRLRQVIINLANNAIKFTHEGFIEIRFDILHQFRNQIELKVSVIDSGIGMSSDQIQKIFQPFTQADMSTTRKYGGTGLGLALSRHLVHLMGGEVHVSSVKSEGTTFSFNAHFGVEQESESLYFEDKPLLSELRVLVIEDNQETLVALIRMLESFGINTTPYLANQVSAAQLEESRIDFSLYNLIMLDSSLPTASFAEIGQYLKQKLGEKANKTHVLLMTNISTTIDPLHHRIFDTIIEKPVTPSELHDGLLASLDIRAPVPEDAKFTEEEKSRLLAKLATKKVLIVEDNEINQQVASELIAAFGVTVDCVNNGMEALEILELNLYDMVFMDMQMPILDGIETTRIIREKKLHKGKPIVAMTAHAMVGDRERCLSSGMDDYVSKPIKPEVLYECIRNWLLEGEKKQVGSLAKLLEAVSKEQSAQKNQSKVVQNIAQSDEEKRKLNLEAGIASMDNDESLYFEVLRMFYEKYGEIDSVSSLKRMFEGSERYDFFHTLKGLSATISAGELHQVSLALETTYREKGEAPISLYQQFISALADVVAVIKKELDNH